MKVCILPFFIHQLEKEFYYLNKHADKWLTAVQKCDFRMDKLIRAAKENAFASSPDKKIDDIIAYKKVLQKAGSASVVLLLRIQSYDWKENRVLNETRGVITIGKYKQRPFLFIKYEINICYTANQSPAFGTL